MMLRNLAIGGFISAALILGTMGIVELLRAHPEYATFFAIGICFVLLTYAVSFFLDELEEDD